VKPEVQDIKDQLQRIQFSMDFLQKRKFDYEVAVDRALEDPEIRRSLKEAADNVEYFCKKVRENHKALKK
jgi:hypothetical protein